eukprot:3324089-Lingulodinium_polyedra.AAC.1
MPVSPLHLAIVLGKSKRGVSPSIVAKQTSPTTSVLAHAARQCFHDLPMTACKRIMGALGLPVAKATTLLSCLRALLDS